jgi:hypothetical protein
MSYKNSSMKRTAKESTRLWLGLKGAVIIGVFSKALSLADAFLLTVMAK